MSAYIEPCIIYGFGEGKYDREKVIDCNWIDINYPYVQIYADEIYKNIPGETFYGIECFTWGKINETEKKVVDIFCKYINLYKKSKNKFAKKLVPDFHLVIKGDFNWDKFWSKKKYHPEADMELPDYDDVLDYDLDNGSDHESENKSENDLDNVKYEKDVSDTNYNKELNADIESLNDPLWPETTDVKDSLDNKLI